MSKALFITIEGIDGAGKGTQIDYIIKFLNEKAIDYLFLREPGGTEIGEAIRDILLDKKYKQMTDITELLLFAAARAQIVEEVIRPSLAEGKLVLCDRFFDSTLAYQAGGRGIDEQKVYDSIAIATSGLVPDLTLYLDLDSNIASMRLANRDSVEEEHLDRIELEEISFKQRVREKYIQIANSEDRVRLIDADRPPEEVWQDIQKVLREYIN